jgi:hypothetical protein
MGGTLLRENADFARMGTEMRCVASFSCSLQKIGLRRYPSNEQHDGEHSHYHCLLPYGPADLAWFLLWRC